MLSRWAGCVSAVTCFVVGSFLIVGPESRPVSPVAPVAPAAPCGPAGPGVWLVVHPAIESTSENVLKTTNVLIFTLFSFVEPLDPERRHRGRLHAARMLPIAPGWRCPNKHTVQGNVEGGKLVLPEIPRKRLKVYRSLSESDRVSSMACSSFVFLLLRRSFGTLLPPVLSGS